MADVPVVLCDTQAVVAGADPAAAGALWRLQAPTRDLDSNVIQLPPGERIEAHTGPEFDVLVHVLHGTGRLGTVDSDVELRAGMLLLLPKRSQRSFTAGRDGLRYLTVHQRKPGLSIGHAPPA